MTEADKIKAAAIVTCLIVLGVIAFVGLPIFWWGEAAGWVIMAILVGFSMAAAIFVYVYMFMFEDLAPPVRPQPPCPPRVSLRNQKTPRNDAEWYRGFCAGVEEAQKDQGKT